MTRRRSLKARDTPDGEPAPVEHSLWSTVQAAVNGGWGTTTRLILIMTIVIVMILLLGTWAATPIPAILHLVR